MARRYISNKNESVRMFESNFLEWFSHVHPLTPVVLYLPVIVWMLWRSVTVAEFPILSIVGLFIVGALMWSFSEYILHRFVFHYEPKTVWGRRVHFLMHGVHHDYPNDATRLVMPPGFSVPLAFLFYFLFLFAFGFNYMSPIFAGFVAGYVFYDTLHYATHHISLKRGVWAWLKKHHMRHHYGDDEHYGFGVSSPLWDYVFGTHRYATHSSQQQSQPVQHKAA